MKIAIKLNTVQEKANIMAKQNLFYVQQETVTENQNSYR